MFNSQAQSVLEASEARYANLSVGDKVIAPLPTGASYETARIYAIEDNRVFFLRAQVIWSVEMELAMQTVVLLEKFDCEQVIAEILALVA